ncbi:hypothetical protein [Evansella clarkii]|uniref:hypothetical protein n=1 Tax=Evansella clarkii TaxID=79879 RepID=UPI001472E78F|nr:hypothetical protein [Evansella clarkii]
MIKKQNLKTTDDVKAQFITYCKISDDFEHCILCLACRVTMAVYPDGSESFYHCGC